jgi:two-component system, NtrC family, response regulator AtoC
MQPPNGNDEPTKTRQGDGGSRRPRILVLWQGGFASRELTLPCAVTFGRSHDADIQINDGSVSRLHARLVIADRAMIEDLGSSNGTRVAGQSLAKGKPVEIRPGDRVEVGAATVIIDMPSLSPDHTSGSNPTLRLGGAMEWIERAAPTPLPVLIVGETGVGKEVAARILQERSPRARAPFIRLNCAALSEQLLESELFGHERGAFTGAEQAKPGLIESAHTGTLFLDEVGELPLGAQAKLLRVIESGEATRVGAVTPRTIDVRFVLATNRDLPQRIAQGAFRQDLFFRINGVTIAIPPLRDRREEIEPLARFFSTEASARVGRAPTPLEAAAVSSLIAYAWPGNVRELRHVSTRRDHAGAPSKRAHERSSAAFHDDALRA